MIIVTLSYTPIPTYQEPSPWLQRIDFFTGILDQLALTAKIHSFHHINYKGRVEQNNVQYHFTGLGRSRLILPFRFHQTVKLLRPDLIIIQGFHYPFQALLLRIFLGKKVQLWVQHHAERPLRFHKKILQRVLDLYITGYFFTSIELARPWIAKRQITDENKIVEVMECSSVYHSDLKMSNRKITATGKKNYLWVGRLESNKDPITLVEAFLKFSAIHPDAKLYIIYQEDDLLPQVSLVIKNNSNIILVGKQDKSQLLSWYNSAEFIISTSHYEGSGIAVCEGMSCGCIPILSSIPSFRWMTGNGKCGLLFEKGDPESLFQALKKSTELDILEEQNKTIQLFDDRLSFKSIAQSMLAAISKRT